MNNFELRRALMERLTLPKYQAGKVMGWGRRLTDKAVKAGQMPVIDGPKEPVPTEWLRKQLQIESA